MRNPTAPLPGRSALGPLMAQLIQEKRAAGYGYVPQSDRLNDLDRFLSQEGLTRIELPKDLARRWCAKRDHESAKTHRFRIYVVRQLAEFLGRHGYPAWTPDSKLTTIPAYDFVPHIFSAEEVRKLFAAADALDHGAGSLRHLIMPEIFRVLYGCGLRAGEARRLTVADVDLTEGVLTIRQSKFRKDRLVPLAPSLRDRLRRYADRMGHRGPEAIFFPGRGGGLCAKSTLYQTFRDLLWRAGITHAGRGRGPRLHDIRHTFAVHRLVRWYRSGDDLNARLLVLATYLGHQGLDGTQRYLRLTAEIFPELAARLQDRFGDLVPGGDLP
jgi:integrase/recombinase XerD